MGDFALLPLKPTTALEKRSNDTGVLAVNSLNTNYGVWEVV